MELLFRVGSGAGPGGRPPLTTMLPFSPVVGFTVALCFASLAAIISDSAGPQSAMRLLAGTGSMIGSVASLLWIGGVGKTVQASWTKYVLLQLCTFCACISGGWAGTTSKGNNMLPLAYSTAFWLVCPIEAGNEILVLLVQLAETVVSVVLHMSGLHSHSQPLAQALFLYGLIGMAVPVVLVMGLMEAPHSRAASTAHAASVPPTAPPVGSQAATVQTEYDSVLLQLLECLHFSCAPEHGPGAMVASVLSDTAAAHIVRGQSDPDQLIPLPAAAADTAITSSTRQTGAGLSLSSWADSVLQGTSHISSPPGQTSPKHPQPAHGLSTPGSSLLQPLPTNQLVNLLAQWMPGVTATGEGAGVHGVTSGAEEQRPVAGRHRAVRGVHRSSTFSHTRQPHEMLFELGPISYSQGGGNTASGEANTQFSSGHVLSGALASADSVAGTMEWPSSHKRSTDNGRCAAWAADARGRPPVAGEVPGSGTAGEAQPAPGSVAQMHILRLGVRRTRSLNNLRAATRKDGDELPSGLPPHSMHTVAPLRGQRRSTGVVSAAALQALLPIQAEALAAAAQPLAIQRLSSSNGSISSTRRSSSGAVDTAHPLQSGAAPPAPTSSPVRRRGPSRSTSSTLVPPAQPGPATAELQVRVRLVLEYTDPAANAAAAVLSAAFLPPGGAPVVPAAAGLTHSGGSASEASATTLHRLQEDVGDSSSGRGSSVSVGPFIRSRSMGPTGHVVPLTGATAANGVARQRPGPTRSKSRFFASNFAKDGRSTASGHSSGAGDLMSSYGAGVYGGATTPEHSDFELSELEHTRSASMFRGASAAEESDASVAGRRLVADVARTMHALHALASTERRRRGGLFTMHQSGTPAGAGGAEGAGSNGISSGGDDAGSPGHSGPLSVRSPLGSGNYLAAIMSGGDALTSNGGGSVPGSPMLRKRPTHGRRSSTNTEVMSLAGFQLTDRDSFLEGGAGVDDDPSPSRAIATLVAHIAAAEAGDVSAHAALEEFPAEAVAAARELLAAANEVQGRAVGWVPPAGLGGAVANGLESPGLQHLPPVLLAALQSSTSGSSQFDANYVNSNAIQWSQVAQGSVNTPPTRSSVEAGTMNPAAERRSVAIEDGTPAGLPSSSPQATASSPPFTDDMELVAHLPRGTRRLMRHASCGALRDPAAAAAGHIDGEQQPGSPRLCRPAASNDEGHGNLPSYSPDSPGSRIYKRAMSARSAGQLSSGVLPHVGSSQDVGIEGGRARLRLRSVSGVSPLLLAYGSETGFGSVMHSLIPSSGSHARAQSSFRTSGAGSFLSLLNTGRGSVSWAEVRASNDSFYGWASFRGPSVTPATGGLVRHSCSVRSNEVSQQLCPNSSGSALLDEDEDVLQVAGALALDLHPSGHGAGQDTRRSMGTGAGSSEVQAGSGRHVGEDAHWSAEDARQTPVPRTRMRMRADLSESISGLHNAIISGGVTAGQLVAMHGISSEPAPGAGAATVTAAALAHRSQVHKDSSFRFFTPLPMSAPAPTPPPSQEAGVGVEGADGLAPGSASIVSAAGQPLRYPIKPDLMKSSSLSSASTGPISEDAPGSSAAPAPRSSGGSLARSLLAMSHAIPEESSFTSHTRVGLRSASATGVGAGGSSPGPSLFSSSSTSNAPLVVHHASHSHGGLQLAHSAHSSYDDGSGAGGVMGSGEHGHARLPGLLPPVVPEQRERSSRGSGSQLFTSSTGGPMSSQYTNSVYVPYGGAAGQQVVPLVPGGISLQELMNSRYSGTSANSSQGHSSAHSRPAHSTFALGAAMLLNPLSGASVGHGGGTSGSGLEEEPLPLSGAQYRSRSLTHNSSMDNRLHALLTSANLSHLSHTSAEHNSGSTLVPTAAPHSPAISQTQSMAASRWALTSKMSTRAPSLTRSARGGNDASSVYSALVSRALKTGLGSGAGDTLEIELEDILVAHRRIIDASRVLLEELHVEKVLGFGSMGIVYFGALWGVRVVVKMIEHGTGVLGKEQNRGRLARTEAIVSRMLLHPNIVLTYDVCTGALDASRLKVSPVLNAGGLPRRGPAARGRQRQMTVMVQEFCELGTLKDALSSQKYGLEPGGPDHVRLVVQLALDVAQGMRYMHGLRVLHVDLKAENVLLCRPPSAPALAVPGRVPGLAAKVADFGLAQVLPLDRDVLHTGIHGTVSHMPPEAMRGTQFSCATDVYSFGIVLWELVTCAKPFPGLPAFAVVEAVCERGERPPWPEDLGPVLEGVRGLAEACWDTDPSRRPSFREVVDCLTPLMAAASGNTPNAHGLSGHSVLSDESDELEAALREQELRASAPAPAPRGSISPSWPARGRRDTRASGMGTDLLGTGRDLFSTTVNSDVLAAAAAATAPAGPPNDMLGRMLYFLTQPPPHVEEMAQVALPKELGVRLCVVVDMTGVDGRGDGGGRASSAGL